jgi:hypothetical protein
MSASRFPVISLISSVYFASFQGFARFFKGFLDFTAPIYRDLRGLARKTFLRARDVRAERARVIGRESLANNLRMQFCKIEVFCRPSPESFAYKNRKL